RPTHGAVVRPLLALPRTALRAALAAAGLHPIADPGNSDPRQPRAFVRHHLLPPLACRDPAPASPPEPLQTPAVDPPTPARPAPRAPPPPAIASPRSPAARPPPPTAPCRRSTAAWLSRSGSTSPRVTMATTVPPSSTARVLPPSPHRSCPTLWRSSTAGPAP